jgi:glutathione synthase/RimK-type ligase-like ATP-grasp enzyme
MILLCGIPSEPPLRLVIEAAKRRGVPYVLFNQRETQYADICLEVKDGQVNGAIRIWETDWPLHQFSGVYVRLMDYQDLPENKPRGRTPADADAVYKSQVFHSTLTEWLEMTSCRVMNRTRAMSSNMSKPYQAQFITRAGFRVPNTLITNDPEEVRNFLRVHRRVIYKSVSSIRSVVKVLSDIKLNELEDVRHLPTQFQAFVPGTNVRVHVVGDAVFATEIHTEAVDYRYASQEERDIEMIPVNLPQEIVVRCLNLSNRLDLPLCGIDLKRTPDGAYYCFEVNPSPAYSYYQQNSGQDIATAIVKYLQ